MSATQKPEHPRLPSVDELLRSDEFAVVLALYGHPAVRDQIRLEQATARKAGAVRNRSSLEYSALVTEALEHLHAPSLRPVFNLTGTILHTNLGRAPLPQVAIDAMVAAAGAVNLEYELSSGTRGQRDKHLENWITRLTGAQAALVVNNNAAAVLIVLNTFASKKEAIISRGELIEIGGSFRIPEIMERANATLCEVGTTNRTHQKDFEKALGPASGMILKVHTSNYRVQGFTKVVPERDLAALAEKADVPFVVDLGIGTLVDLTQFGLPHETTVRETLENGADLVTLAGGKLLGGPQAGIIAGRADLIAEIAANPMKRALRLDKVTIAALAAVLRLYANPDLLTERVPAIRLLGRSAGNIKAQATRLLSKVKQSLAGVADVKIEPCRSQIGSGALPVETLDSHCLTLTPLSNPDDDLRDLAAQFRALPMPVIGRISNGTLKLDLRALEREDKFLLQLSSLVARS